MRNLFFAAVAVVLLAGCSSTNPNSFAPLHRQDMIRTQTVYTVTLDKLTGATSTNASDHIVTQAVYTVSAPLSNAIETAAGIAAVVPSPWGGLASVGLTLALGALGWIAKLKSRQATMLDAVIAGVEKANQPEVKAAIAAAADLAGVKTALHNQVKKVTE